MCIMRYIYFYSVGCLDDYRFNTMQKKQFDSNTVKLCTIPIFLIVKLYIKLAVRARLTRHLVAGLSLLLRYRYRRCRPDALSRAIGMADGDECPLCDEQEEALIGLMYNEFMANDAMHLDYEKVGRFAMTIQTDEAVCSALGLAVVAEEGVWHPTAEWITAKCLAFKEHASSGETQPPASKPDSKKKAKEKKVGRPLSAKSSHRASPAKSSPAKPKKAAA